MHNNTTEDQSYTTQSLTGLPQLARTATYLVGGGGGDSPPLFLDHLTTNDIADDVLLDSNTNENQSNNKPQYSKCEIYGGSRKGAKTFQEDSYFSYTTSNNKCIVGGVMDGHGGYNGMIASQTARDTALDFFDKHSSECESWSIDEWKSHLHDLFLHMHQTIRNKFIEHNSAHGHTEQRHIDDKGIVRTANNDPVHGGSTCTIVVLIKSSNNKSATIISANVGDSTSLLLPVNKLDAPSNLYEFLSTDHGPEASEEFMRIKQMNISTRLLLVYDKTTVMRKFECPTVFNEDGKRDEQLVSNPWGHGLHPTNVRYEPAVYAVTPRTVSKDSTCIAMTRALGDFYAHQFGLTCEPDINVRSIKISTMNNVPFKFTLVVASDGIWDCWKYDDFAEYVSTQLIVKHSNVTQAGDNILDESISRAVHNFGAKHYDDAALVMFCWP